MDFFERQERARQNTGSLIFYFVLGVIAVTAMVCLSVAMVMPFFYLSAPELAYGDIRLHFAWAMGVTALATACLILGGSWLKTRALRREGGQGVARMLGGEPVSPDTTDLAERKLLNVVQEMAIASGLPSPPVYMLGREHGLNGFAAGYEPYFAVIGVTRGLVDFLNRDELQGVMGHEFSHILNGDMRLNIRLMGMVHGIMLISLTGRALVSASLGPGRRGRFSSSREGKFFLPGAVLGGLLMLVGFGGAFFANLIKAAVSRQREYLADAAAVQFTRNPKGVAGALKKIGGHALGSNMNSPLAAQASHMFFNWNASSFFERLLASHPPLSERIRRIDPLWDGKFPLVNEKVRLETALSDRIESASLAVGLLGPESGVSVEPEGVISKAGRLQAAYLDRAGRLLAAIPQELKARTGDPGQAQAVIHAMVLSWSDPRARQAQLDLIMNALPLDLYDLCRDLAPLTEKLDQACIPPLIDLCVPALRKLSPQGFSGFKSLLLKLIKADKRLGVYEWTLARIIIRHAARAHDGGRARFPTLFDLEPVSRECRVLLTGLARFSKGGVEKGFKAGASVLGLDLSPLEPGQCGLKEIGQSLEKLNSLSWLLKRKLLWAAAACVSSDGLVSPREGALLRAAADALECPMPPILPGQREVLCSN